MAEKARVLLVDGYNVLGAWPDITKARQFSHARDILAERLHNYAGYTDQKVILVYDAWQSDHMKRSIENRDGLQIVFTQKGETADQYIERQCGIYASAIDAGRLEVRVATSDAVEQTLALGRGAVRLSARELIYEIVQTTNPSVNRQTKSVNTGKRMVMDRLSCEVREKLEKMRRGE